MKKNRIQGIGSAADPWQPARVADIYWGILDFPFFGARREVLPTLREVLPMLREVLPTLREVLLTLREVLLTLREVLLTLREVLPTRGERPKSNRLLVDTRGKSNRTSESTYPWLSIIHSKPSSWIVGKNRLSQTTANELKGFLADSQQIKPTTSGNYWIKKSLQLLKTNGLNSCKVRYEFNSSKKTIKYENFTCLNDNH